MLTFPDWQAVVYVGLVEGALLTAVVVLYLHRRRAPRACALGMCGFGGLLVFNAAVVAAGPLLVYSVQTGDVVGALVWRLQVLALTSAAVNAGVIGVVTGAILTDRAPAPEGGD